MKNKTSTKEFKLSNNERLLYESPSIFKPKKFPNFYPKGFKIYTFNAGFKKKLNDLLIIIFDSPANTSSVFSKTSTPSAPIIWNKKNNQNKIKILVVNSGNANAHTGKKGLKIIDSYVNYLLRVYKCKKNQVLVCSTGVIGELFNPKLIINKIKEIQNKKNTSLLDAAKTIITTDTYPKISIQNQTFDKQNIKIYGIAKGSGMIHPNMGTMLAYIFIEAALPFNIIKKIINHNLDDTFNSITVDSDTSTSDTLSIFSLNMYKINYKTKKNFEKLNSSIKSIMKDLSIQIIKDGEGLSKLLNIEVVKAKSKRQAKKIGLSVANSPLVKTAIFGEDANWGRIIMAVGKSNEKVIQDKIKIYFGPYLICSNGSINTRLNQSVLKRYMKKNIIKIKINLGIGNFSHNVYGNDLSYKYININGDYRS